MSNTVYVTINRPRNDDKLETSISEPDEELRVRFCSPATALKRISILRSMNGDSKWLQDAERRVRKALSNAR